jgi:hypothetical protein
MDYWQYLQLLNAFSMLSGIYFAFTHVFEHDCFFKKMSAYSYIGVEKGREKTKETSRGHIWSLTLDLCLQDACIFFTAFSTVMKHYGSIWIMLSSVAFTLWSVMGNTPPLVRHLNNSIVIGLLSADNFGALCYFGAAIICYLIARHTHKAYFLHSAFHVFLSFAMNSIWKYDYRHEPTLSFIPPVVADALAASSTVIIGHLIVHTYINEQTKKILQHAMQFAYNVFFFILNTYCFCQLFSWDAVFDIEPLNMWNSSLKNTQVSYMLGYYFGCMMYDIFNKDYTMVFHHILALFCIVQASFSGYYHFMNINLFVYSHSTQLLTAAKLFKTAKYHQCAKVCFGCFAVVFFISRVCAVPFILYYTIVGGWHTSKLYPYITINSMLFFIYLLQLYWFGKIMKILVPKKIDT